MQVAWYVQVVGDVQVVLSHPPLRSLQWRHRLLWSKYKERFVVALPCPSQACAGAWGGGNTIQNMGWMGGGCLDRPSSAGTGKAIVSGSMGGGGGCLDPDLTHNMMILSPS